MAHGRPVLDHAGHLGGVRRHRYAGAHGGHGCHANAAAATAEKGHALLDAMGRSLAQLLLEIDQLPPGTLQDATAY